jgi:hypothetical protein
MKTQIINLTPHDINVFDGDKQVLTIPASGTIATVKMAQKDLPPVNGIPVVTTDFGDVQNLPSPQPNTIFIVSLLVKGRCPRKDLVNPTNFVRKDGKILGCQAFNV